MLAYHDITSHKILAIVIFTIIKIEYCCYYIYNCINLLSLSLVVERKVKGLSQLEKVMVYTKSYYF